MQRPDGAHFVLLGDTNASLEQPKQRGLSCHKPATFVKKGDSFPAREATAKFHAINTTPSPRVVIIVGRKMENVNQLVHLSPTSQARPSGSNDHSGRKN